MTTLLSPRRRAIAVLLASLAVAGCGGPEAQLRFGGRAIPINVAFGGASADDPRAPTIPVEPVPVPSGVGFVPSASPVRGFQPAPTTPTTLPVFEACPEPSALAFPSAEADVTVRGLPRQATYSFRTTGTSSVGSKKSAFSLVAEERVEGAEQRIDGSYAFRTVTTMLDVKTTTEYVVQPPVDLAPGQIGLAGVTSEPKGAPTTSFRPPKPLKIMELKAAPGVEYTDATNDPLSATSATITATTFGRDRVKACGAVIDAWVVIGEQHFVSPTEDVTVSISRWFATQFGGLVVQEKVSYTGRVGLDEVEGGYTRVINQDPGV